MIETTKLHNQYNLIKRTKCLLLLEVVQILRPEDLKDLEEDETSRLLV